MIKKSESITALSKALVQTQKELKQPLKDADNPFFKSKYVPLENVVDSITETATQHGLGFTQFPTMDENGLVVVGTMVVHESGEWIEYEPIKLKPVKNDPQAVGSAITYAKRYALSAIFGITSDQDDDGNEATQPNNQKSASRNTSDKKSQNQSVKIGKLKVTSYKNAIDVIVRKTGKADGSITKWFCEQLGVIKVEDITEEQVPIADALISKLQSKKVEGEKHDKSNSIGR